jgi:hypothetical protein
MNSRFDLLDIIRRQPGTQLAEKIMRRRMHEGQEFADMLQRKRNERAFKVKVSEDFDDMDNSQ